MKIRVVYLTSLLILVLKVSMISNAPSAPATKISLKVNSIGQKTLKHSVLVNIPMTVKSCDQIAFFKAKYITDLADYREKASGWFSVTAYTINLYQNKDANKLIHSVDLGNLKIKPALLAGGLGCIKVDGGSVSADITICLPNKSQADNILKVIDTFYRCRRGDNLVPIPPHLLRELLQMCAKGEGRLLRGPLRKKGLIPLRAGNKWDQDRLNYFHPAPIVVPGAGGR